MARSTERVARVWQEIVDWFAWNFSRSYYQCEAELPFENGEGCAICIRKMGHTGKHRTNDGEFFSDGR